MEELQLALTATRVEQKNFGLWLKSWQVGQVLQALVTDKSPAGNLVLRIGGHQITATADIPVQKGAVLMLEVQGLKPVPTLKVTGSFVDSHVAQNVTAKNSIVDGQLQLLVPRQGSVAVPLTSLLDPVQGAKILAQLGLRSDALEQLKRSLNRFEGLSNPGALQKALQQSGFFLESQLRQLVLSGGYLPEGDIKAELLRILDRVNRKIGAKSGDTEEELDALFLLKERLESGLAGITLQQVASFKRNEGGHQGWFFEIPYRTDDGVETLTILIERDNASLDEHEDRQDWKVLLSLELKPLGEMQAELFLRGKRISVVIYSEQEKTAQLVNSQLDALKLGLESRGLEVSVLRCQSGIRDVKKEESIYRCLNETA